MISDGEFSNSNQIFEAATVELKRQGSGKVCLFLLYDCLIKGKFKYITKHLMYGPSGNYLVLINRNCFLRDHALSV